MWWSDRRQFLLLAGAVGACGFQPAYGPGGSAEGLNGRIEVAEPRNRLSFNLVRQLETRLGLPDAPEYMLTTALSVNQSQLGLTTDNEITRYNVRGRATFTLNEIGTGRVATRGTVENFTSYSDLATPFATQTASNDALDRLMVILADQIVARLLVTAGEWRA